MTTLATRNTQEHTTEGTLFVAFELSEKTWKLGFSTGHGQKPRERTVTARQQERVLDEIAQAKRRLGLPDTAPVVRCSEAGRDGCWLQRFLQGHGITTPVVDAVGGTSVEAHEAALRRIEQAGGKLISWTQLLCELQRDWARKETVPAFMDLFIQTGGTAGIQFSYDKAD